MTEFNVISFNSNRKWNEQKIELLRMFQFMLTHGIYADLSVLHAFIYPLLYSCIRVFMCLHVSQPITIQLNIFLFYGRSK